MSFMVWGKKKKKGERTERKKWWAVGRWWRYL
jgi:hypothetical protein